MDVMAPDLGTDEQTMAWIYDTYSMHVGYACPEIVTGKPVELGGCVGRREATGRGVVYCIMEALKELNLQPGEATAVVQGFGNVGAVVCQELVQRGVRLVAVGDRYRGDQQSAGDQRDSFASSTWPSGQFLRDFPGAEPMPAEQLLTTPCTILVPAALERVITQKNAAQLRCRLLAEGSQRSDDARSRRDPGRQRHLHHSRRLVQRGRRYRLLLRMGAGHAAILLERRGSESKARGANAQSVSPGLRPGPETRVADAYSGPEPGSTKGSPRKSAARIIPVRIRSDCEGDRWISPASYEETTMSTPHAGDDIVRLSTAANPLQAHIWEQALKEAGIRCKVVGDYPRRRPGRYPRPVGGALGPSRRPGPRRRNPAPRPGSLRMPSR